MTSPSAQQPPPEQEQEYPAALPRWNPRQRDEMCGCEGRGLLAGSARWSPAATRASAGPWR
jgi:hypothetical protein